GVVIELRAGLAGLTRRERSLVWQAVWSHCLGRRCDREGACRGRLLVDLCERGIRRCSPVERTQISSTEDFRVEHVSTEDIGVQLIPWVFALERGIEGAVARVARAEQ